jgi:nitroreductase
MSADLVLEALRWRYATKAFDPAVPVSDADWFALTEAFRLSPSSYGVQPWKLIDVVSPEVREALAQAAPLNTTKIMTCSRLAVLANLRHISPEYLEAYYCDLATTRGFERAQIDGFATMVSADVAAKGPAGQANWTVAQTYIALGLMGSAAAVMHIDLSPMEGIDRAAGTDSAPATACRARNR